MIGSNPGYHYRPFHDELLDAAALLLAARQQCDRQQQALLPARFTDVATARQAIAAQWQRPWSSGVAAFDGGQLVGYLIGYMQVDQFFGRAVWSRPAGYALANGVDSDFYRDLYAAAAARWVDWGCFDHLVVVPALPLYLEPWALLGFGRMQAYALRPLNEAPLTVPAAASNLTIRQANKSDADHLRAMALLIAEHQLQAPTWALMPPESMLDRPDQYAGIVDDDEATCWLAFRGEEAVGFQVLYPAEMDDDALYTPTHCIELAVAGTQPAWRGQGVMRALTAYALAQAYSEGYRHVLTDWRTTNLTSSRAWPRAGFSPVAYRLHRHVDARIAWGQNR